MIIHAGPDYLVHYKISQVLNIVFVTMMYGLGLPILFPIATLSIFIIYAVERYQLAYVYQQPPAYDDKIIQKAIGILSYSPLLLLVNGFWMLSNRQMFENIVYKLSYSTLPMPTGHSIESTLHHARARPMLLMILFCLLLRIIH